MDIVQPDIPDEYMGTVAQTIPVNNVFVGLQSAMVGATLATGTKNELSSIAVRDMNVELRGLIQVDTNKDDNDPTKVEIILDACSAPNVPSISKISFSLKNIPK